jgi:cyclin-dependent kinase 12/13
MNSFVQVEQMHKIFKLCGSPSEDYWQRTKLPYATSFKPQNSYRRHVADAFKHFPSTALALVDKLLSMEPEKRGSATSALESEVILHNILPLFSFVHI